MYTVLAAVCELWTNLPDELKNSEDRAESTASLKELNEIYKENCAQVRPYPGPYLSRPLSRPYLAPI